jgi:hypothetical protein
MPRKRGSGLITTLVLRLDGRGRMLELDDPVLEPAGVEHDVVGEARGKVSVT